eukprot:12314834-Alexandrium_andersonii.AAC.1
MSAGWPPSAQCHRRSLGRWPLSVLRHWRVLDRWPLSAQATDGPPTVCNAHPEAENRSCLRQLG